MKGKVWIKRIKITKIIIILLAFIFGLYIRGQYIGELVGKRSGVLGCAIKIDNAGWFILSKKSCGEFEPGAYISLDCKFIFCAAKEYAIIEIK